MSPPTTMIPQELQRSHASLVRRITDVRDYQLPRLEQLASGVDKHAELCAELKADLDAIARSLEGLAELAEEQVLEEERKQGRRAVEELERQVEQLRKDYRRAAVASKAAIKGAPRRATETIETTPAVATTPGDDALQTKTNEVTDALRRTTALMQSELERSVLSVQILDDSTQTIRATQTLYSRYESLLSTSTKLVKQLERADWYDRVIILTALLFFLLVVGFIVKRRVLDKAVSGVGWWVGGSFKLVGMGLGLRSSGRVDKLSEKMAQGVDTRSRDVLEAAAPARTKLSDVLEAAASGADTQLGNVLKATPDVEPVGAIGGRSIHEL